MRRNYFLAMILIGAGMILTVGDRNLKVDGSRQTNVVVVRNHCYQPLYSMLTEPMMLLMLDLMLNCDSVESMEPRRDFYKHLKNTLLLRFIFISFFILFFILFLILSNDTIISMRRDDVLWYEDCFTCHYVLLKVKSIR